MSSFDIWFCSPTIRKRRKSGSSNCSEQEIDENNAILRDQADYGAVTEVQPVELYPVDEIDGISISSDISLRRVYIAKDNSVWYTQNGLPKIPLALAPGPGGLIIKNSLSGEKGAFSDDGDLQDNACDHSAAEISDHDVAVESTLDVTDSDGSVPQVVAELADLDTISELEPALKTVESVRSNDSGVSSLDGTSSISKKKRKLKKPKFFKSFHMSLKKKKKKLIDSGTKRSSSFSYVPKPSMTLTPAISMASSLSSTSQRKYSAALLFQALDDLSDDNICKE